MEYSNDTTLNQIAKEIFDKHKLHSYDSKIENIRFSKSGNIVIELADNQRFVFDDKYKMLNGSIIKKNIVYLREEELEFCQNIADSLLEEHKDDVILIAETLLAHETITSEQIAYLLEHRKLPEENVSAPTEIEVEPLKDESEGKEGEE